MRVSRAVSPPPLQAELLRLELVGQLQSRFGMLPPMFVRVCTFLDPRTKLKLGVNYSNEEDKAQLLTELNLLLSNIRFARGGEDVAMLSRPSAVQVAGSKRRRSLEEEAYAESGDVASASAQQSEVDKYLSEARYHRAAATATAVRGVSRLRAVQRAAARQRATNCCKGRPCAPQAPAPRESNPLAVWKDMRHRFPILSILAASYVT